MAEGRGTISRSGTDRSDEEEKGRGEKDKAKEEGGGVGWRKWMGMKTRGGGGGGQPELKITGGHRTNSEQNCFLTGQICYLSGHK